MTSKWPVWWLLKTFEIFFKENGHAAYQMKASRKLIKSEKNAFWGLTKPIGQKSKTEGVFCILNWARDLLFLFGSLSIDQHGALIKICSLTSQITFSPKCSAAVDFELS